MTNYKVRVGKKVKKFLDKRDDKFVLNFYEKAKKISNGDFLEVDTKPLAGKPKGFFRLRIGKYRIFYQVLEEEILIYFFEVDSKGDAY